VSGPCTGADSVHVLIRASRAADSYRLLSGINPILVGKKTARRRGRSMGSSWILERRRQMPIGEVFASQARHPTPAGAAAETIDTPMVGTSAQNNY